MKGRLKYVDRHGKSTVTTVMGLDATDTGIMAKLSNFALTLRGYSNAAITEYGVSRPDVETFTGENAAVGSYDSSMHKAVLRFKYVEDNESKSIVLNIPAPNGDMFTEVQDVGYRIDQGSGEGVRDALITATGIADLAFVDGILDYSGGKSVRPSAGAYVMFKDTYGRDQYMGIAKVTDLSKLVAFCALFTGVSDYTLAAPQECGIITPEIAFRSDIPTTELHFDSVEGRAVLNFSYIDGSDKKGITLTVPASKESMFDFVGQKKRLPVKEAIGDLIAVGLSSLLGLTVNFESGKRDKVTLKN